MIVCLVSVIPESCCPECPFKTYFVFIILQ
nr:MAG TPA: hypothetical protein [Caudoviricetes sp.]